MVTVNNLKILKKIRNHKDGEVFFVKDENTATLRLIRIWLIKAAYQ